jgi:hypothetical protein
VRVRKAEYSLRGSHHEIREQLTSIVDQLRRQADSTFGDGKPWSAVSDPEFGNRLIAFAKSLAALGENFNSGKPPQWWLDQQAAYDSSALGQLTQHKRTARNNSETVPRRVYP